MGRIKAKFLKTITHEALEKHPDKYDTDFDKNKETLAVYADIPCKKLRNVVAGYAARLKKAGKY